MTTSSADPYERLEEMERSSDAAERIVAAIWLDVTDRRGWRQEADRFDDGIKHEILDRWLEIVRGARAAHDLDRDILADPYTPAERRVCDYLQMIAPDIGCGPDPIGFLIASHNVLRRAWQTMDRLPPSGLVLAKTDDGRRMIWEASILRAKLDRREPTPDHLQFPATGWMLLP